ncbi:MAG: methyltransferase [Gemmatimonadetes bacterium]|jgi:SAM-dependent methyltransferase|nr:methyltransferase [Gemmatimonadota bacterium]
MSSLLRPDPVPRDADILEINGNARYRQVEEWLGQGRRLCITDTYGTALTLYSWLKRQLRRRSPVRDYRSSRLYREMFWRLTRPLLVPIADHRISLRKAPPIPWLERLYPEQRDFLLPLADLLGLNGAWQWYERGVRYPILDHPMHPYYGVYFSTRSEHLEQFDAWLAEREGTFSTAADIGAGIGALTFLLIKRGLSRVHATDTSPNAVRSVEEDLDRLDLRDRVTLERADLFGSCPPVDLIAFNPPWLPGEQHVPVDAGSYYAADLFPRFFATAAEHLKPEGRLLLLFSNFAELAELTDHNPIARELEEGGRFQLIDRRERPVGPPSRRRGQDWLHALRQKEKVQLWELARNPN